MKDNFEKFKKKVWIDILIKCGIVALLVAFIAVNAVLIPCKLFGVHLLWIFYILIGLSGFALGGGIAFLILRTNDLKIAKRMDAELNLSERVQTALLFGNQKSDMLDMQLENTNEALKPIPARALPFKSIIATALCGFIAVAAIVSVPVVAYAVPSVLASDNENGGSQKDPPRDVSDWEWAALDDLIKYVKASKKADADSVRGMVDALESLKSLLLDGVSQSSLSSFVSFTASQILNVISDANEKYPQSGEELHPQAVANSEEAAYVINRLYEIFDLLSPGNGSTGGDKNGENNGEEEGEGSEGAGGKGSISINETPFFDPEKGYVKCGEVRNEYYEQVQNALAEGVISSEEWEYIMITYFADLGVKEDD